MLSENMPFSFTDNVKKMESKMKKASELGIHVVDVSFLDAFKTSNNESAAFLIAKKNIAPWDCPNVNILGMSGCLNYNMSCNLCISDWRSPRFERVGWCRSKWIGKIKELRLVNVFSFVP